MAEQISAVRTGLHVLVANALTTRVTGDDVGRTVWLFVDSTRGLISLAEYFVAGGTLCLILLTDLLAASTTGIQMTGSEWIFAVSTFCNMVQTVDFVSIAADDGV
ncbi:hypothetical protein [Halorubrum sp. Ib24]|uniref:hypothetical protein n=1 Tax=Halorubrum sp. Ib24 TaxID=1383850 RepID=UPI0013033AC7|nr:hypothetical protein [Halorubrum sp. Ib24]